MRQVAGKSFIDSGRELYSKYNQILGLIVIMTNNADKWLLKKS